MKTHVLQLIAIALAITPLQSRQGSAEERFSQTNKAEFERLLRLQETQRAVTLGARIAPAAPATTLERLLNWNRIALETTALDHTPVEPGTGDDPRRFAQQLGPHRSSYAMAIAHIAMFEAVNAVHQKYKSYTNMPASDQGYATSPIVVDRAIAHAAHAALVHLYPYQKDRLDGLLSTELARMPREPAEHHTIGTEIGKQAAQSIIQLRQNDGSDHQEPTYGVGYIPANCPDLTAPCPGVWRPDPVSQLTVALGAKWGTVKPFVVTSASQFRPAAPPALNSAEYTAAYEEVREYGSLNSTKRRDFQEFEGLFWAYDGTPNLCAPPRLYNQVAVKIALDQGYGNVADFARLLALINTAMADAGISAWEAKYHFALWRPIGGIRANDPTWTPLGAPATNGRGPNFTPPFPAYPSGHATFGGALFGVLRHFWPDDTPFTFVSDEFNGLNYPVGANAPRKRIPQSYVSLSHAEYSNGRSRIWLGIHWQYDADSGINQGRQIADHVFMNAFQPVNQSASIR